MNIEKVIDGLKRMRIGLFNAKIDKEPIRPYLDAAISALEAQQADMWIPVTEKLPDENERADENGKLIEFLLQLKNGYAIACIDNSGWFRYYTKGTEYGIEKAYYHSPVAWKPLPEPWKEEQP